MYLSSPPSSTSTLEWSRTTFEGMESRGSQGKGRIKPLLTVTGFSLPQAVAVWGEMAAALNNTGINQGLDNLIIVLNWDSGFVSSSAQRMFTTWEWAEKSWDSPCFYPVAFKGKTKGAFWLYPMSPDFSTCQLYMYTFFKMFLNYKYCFAANISHLALY